MYLFFAVVVFVFIGVFSRDVVFTVVVFAVVVFAVVVFAAIVVVVVFLLFLLLFALKLSQDPFTYFRFICLF